MTTRSEIERVLDRYLAEGEEQVPDRVIDAALDQIDSTNQRRALRVPWRFHEMPSLLKLALAGAAIAAVLVVGGMFLVRGPTPAVGGPGVASPSASATTPPSPSVAAVDTSDWVPFTSTRYGYTLARPPSYYAEPAQRDWSLEKDHLAWTGFGVADRFVDNTASILVTAFAADVPSGTSEEEWIAAYFDGYKDDSGKPCVVSTTTPEPVTVDGHAGTLRAHDACEDAHAFVFMDGRVHVFAIWRPQETAVLRAFLSTVKFDR